jgi:hypothetical protein
MFDWLEATIPGAEFKPLRERWERVIAHPEAAWLMRDLVDRARIEVQAALLRSEGEVRSTAAADELASCGVDPLDDVMVPERVAAILGDG